MTVLTKTERTPSSIRGPLSFIRYRDRIYRWSLFPLLIALVACGRGGGDGGGSASDITPPTVLSTSPENNSTDIAVTPAVTATFSEPMDGATLSTTTVTLSDGTSAVSGAVTYDAGTMTATFTPSGELKLSTVYTAMITTGVTDSTGNAIAGDYSWSFITVSSLADPLYGDQWHLKNTGQGGGTPGEDINVEPVWADYKGDGVRIVFVDDGLEINHEDLSPNVATGQNYDYVDHDTNPNSGDHSHGTSVAGVAGARDLNGVGGRGAAPRAGLACYNMLQNDTLSNEADAMTRNAASVDISSNSWGAPDLTGLLYDSNATWRSAVNTGLSTGRGGLGTVYTFAAGNGDSGDCPSVGCLDNSNYDGVANYRGVIAVGAVNDKGVKSSYSERGANLWVSAPAGEFCNTHAITTTDRSGALGKNTDQTAGKTDYANMNYTRCFNGTSSATPLVSGVIALMLQANPGLGWRDVRLVLAQTARKNDPADPEWTTNGAGYHINPNYGFGVIDAQAAVTAAQTWTNVGPPVTSPPYPSSPGLAIPDNDPTGVSDTIAVSGSGIGHIEFVEITFSASDHTYFGDLEITLTHTTTGTKSVLAEKHVCLDDQFNQVDCAPPYDGWIFGSARHLGEAADGTWTLKVKDLAALDTGTFQSWKLQFYGR
jgi:subtilisin-like proprotein convertase family protein